MVALIKAVKISATGNLLHLVGNFYHFLLFEEVFSKMAYFVYTLRGSLFYFSERLGIILHVILSTGLRTKFNHNHIVAWNYFVLMEIVLHNPYYSFKIRVSKCVLIYELIEIYEIIRLVYEDFYQFILKIKPKISEIVLINCSHKLAFS